MKFSPYLAASALCLHSALALQITGGTADTNWRYDPTAANFAGAGIDWSGVGKTERWITMISPNVYVTAGHFAPVVGNTMTFYANNDPTSTAITGTISGIAQQIGTSDLRIGTLDAALPSSIAYYDFYKQAASTIVGTGLSATNAYMVGKNTDNSDVQNFWVGRNRLDGFLPATNAGGAVGDAITAAFNTVGGVTYESIVQVGDSGAPLMIIQNGKPVLVGINWFTGTVGANQVTGFTYLGNYTTEINNFLALHSVPEASTSSLALLSSAALLLRRRRK